MNEETKSKILKLLLVSISLLLICSVALSVGLFVKLKKQNEAVNTSLTIDEDGKDIVLPTKKEDDKEQIIQEADFYSKGLEFLSFGNGTCTLVSMGQCKDNFLIIPYESELGDTVVEISASAFKNNREIKGVELPSTITKIGAYAFYGSTIQAITISKKVVSIGNFAFSNCKKLKSIEVESGNLNYVSVDGTLYSKNAELLIQYPIGKEDSSLSLPRELKEISTLAFFGTTELKKINYQGKKAQWESIEIGAGNDVLDELNFTFLGDIEK